MCCRKSSRLRITLTILRYCGLGTSLSFRPPFHLHPWVWASLCRGVTWQKLSNQGQEADGQKPAPFVSSHSVWGLLAMTWVWEKGDQGCPGSLQLSKKLVLKSKE